MKVSKLLPLGLATLFLASACETHPAEIKIKGPRDSVESTQANPTFATFTKKDDTLQLRASGFDDKGRYMGTALVKWDSSNREVATVSSTGLITVLSSGKADITAKYQKGEVSREASVPVEAIIVKEIKAVEPKPEAGKAIELGIGEIVNFKAAVLNDRGEAIEGAKVRWSSSSWAATVTPTGEVEARAIGTTQIVAEADNGSTARWDLAVEDWKKPGKRR